MADLGICSLTWGFSARWFALFAAADRHLPEQRRNRRLEARRIPTKIPSVNSIPVGRRSPHRAGQVWAIAPVVRAVLTRREIGVVTAAAAETARDLRRATLLLWPGGR